MAELGLLYFVCHYLFENALAGNFASKIMARLGCTQKDSMGCSDYIRNSNSTFHAISYEQLSDLSLWSQNFSPEAVATCD